MRKLYLGKCKVSLEKLAFSRVTDFISGKLQHYYQNHHLTKHFLCFLRRRKPSQSLSHYFTCKTIHKPNSEIKKKLIGVTIIRQSNRVTYDYRSQHEADTGLHRKNFCISTETNQNIKKSSISKLL